MSREQFAASFHSLATLSGYTDLILINLTTTNPWKQHISQLFMIYILKTQHGACFGFIHNCTLTPFVRISGINSRLKCSGDPFKSSVQLPHTYSNRLCDHCHSLQNTSNVKYYAKTRVCKKCTLTPDLRNVCSLTYPWNAPQTIIVFNIIPDM